MTDDPKTKDDAIDAAAASARPKPLYARFWHYWKPVILVLAIILPSRSIIVDWNDVPTGSMIPTIQIGDRIFVNKLAYGVRVPFTMIWLAQWGEIAPGEVITCKSPADSVRLVKRVMGTPGDTLELRNNIVYINNQPLTYEPTQGEAAYAQPDGRRFPLKHELETIGDHTHNVMFNNTTYPRLSEPWERRNYGPVTIPENSYFLMGDNRDFSADSRVFKFVHRDKIFGRTRHILLTFKLKNFFDRLWLPIH